MSIAGLLNQSIILYNKTGYGSGARKSYGAGVTVKARVQLKQRRRMLPNGNIIVTDGDAWIPSDTAVDQDDKITYLGGSYLVFSVYKTIEGTGKVHHIKIEFMKAQTA